MPNSKSSNSVTLSVQKRRSARLAAVQYLYEWKLNEKSPKVERFIETYSERILEDAEEAPRPQEDHPVVPAAAPDFGFARKLINGILEEYEATRRFLSEKMEAGRALDRTSPLIQSLLEAGTYELIHQESLKTSIILSEYTAIAAGFFDNPELAFVNGTLQEIANQVRPQN